jgi:type I restriction enzyme S subunit
MSVELRSCATVFDIKGGTQPPKSTFIDRPKEGYVRLVQIRDFESDAHPTFVPDKPSLNKCEREDVLIGRYGAAVGRICSGLEGAYNVALVKVLPAKDVDRSYLKHLLRSRFFQDPLLGSSGRSAQAGFNRGDLAAIDLPILPSEDQKAAADVLDALDDKIELNRRMSATLEEIARALYRSWFVDFDPVHARALGQSPAHMTPTTAALFPDSFDPDGLPKGWEAGCLGNLIDFNPKERLPKGTQAPYLEMKALPTSGMFADAPYMRDFTSGTKFREHDTLLARITPCLENGKTAVVDDLLGAEIGWGSTEYIVMRAKQGISPALPYCVARDPDFRAEAIQTMTGSSGRQRADAKRIAELSAAIAPASIQVAFNEIVSPMFDRILAAGQESRTLATLRDSLLPRLMSGELRIREAEQQVEEVV